MSENGRQGMAFTPTTAQVRHLGEDLDEGLRLCYHKDHLSKGFWFMWGVPGKQDPMGDKTL